MSDYSMPEPDSRPTQPNVVQHKVLASHHLPSISKSLESGAPKAPNVVKSAPLVISEGYLIMASDGKAFLIDTSSTRSLGITQAVHKRSEEGSELAALSELTGTPLDGIIRMDFMEGNRILIDTVNKTVSILNPIAEVRGREIPLDK